MISSSLAVAIVTGALLGAIITAWALHLTGWFTLRMAAGINLIACGVLLVWFSVATTPWWVLVPGVAATLMLTWVWYAAPPDA